LSEQLSPSEERLLDLLRAGAVAPEVLSEALEDFTARRAAGETLSLGPYLVSAGHVSVTTVQELLAGGDAPDQRDPQIAVELPALPETPGEDSEDRPRNGRSTGARSRRAKRSSGRAERPRARSTRARRSLEPDARGTGKRRRSARAAPPVVKEPAAKKLEELDDEEEGRTARFSPEDLAAASRGESERLQPLAADERTRGFDPEALAASSRRGNDKKGPLLLPILAGAALLVVLVGYVALREPDEIEPLPPPVSPSVALTAPTPGASPSPGGTPAATPDALAERLGDLLQAAGKLEEREDYQGALALYRQVPPELRARAQEALEKNQRRLQQLQRFKVDAAAAVATLRELEVGTPNVAARRKREAAVGTAEALLGGASADQSQTPAAGRLRGALAEVTAAKAGPKALGHDRPQEPAERRKRFEVGAREGARIVAAMKAGIRQARAKAQERRQAAAARVTKRSRESPITAEVGGVSFSKAYVSRYDAQGFSLRANDREVAFDWSRIVASDAQLALRVRRLAIAPKDGRDQLEFGRWCLVNRLWEAAKDAFRRAVLLDAHLKSRVPDVGRIARASQVFRGKVLRTGSSLELSYDFHLPAHNADWTLGGGAQGGVDAERKAYVVRGRGMRMAAMREVGWERTLLIRAVALTHASARSLIGITFQAGTPGEVSYLVGVDPRAKTVLLLRRQDKKLVVLERKPHEAGQRAVLTLACGADSLEARVDDATKFRVAIPSDWGRTRVLIGGSLDRDGQAAFSNVSLSGQARRDWIRKAFGAFDDHLRAYLARTDELELFARPGGRPAAQALSAEDDWGLTGVTDQALAEDRRARIKLALGKPLDLLAASNTFQRALELAPSFAAARYRRGLALERLGRADLALKELRRAAEDAPHFYEARAAEARILARDGQLDEALKVIGAALRERPDYPPGLSAKALIHFRRGELEETQELLDLALALDPWDDEVRAFRRNVRNVRRGPPWERSFREETVHYRVLTDISQVRGRDYADQLETIREFYAEVFGVEGQVRARRATVLIFDTEEGFQAYADLTTDDRVESLLGYYLPRYDQLLLYEGRDDASGDATRRVLYHEAFHQFIYPLIPDLPYWVNEGLADYFSATEIQNGTVISRGASLPARLRDLRRYVQERGRPLSPSGLMRETPSEFYSGPVAVKYAQAWAMVHFFLHGEGGDYLDRFQRYLGALREGETPTDAYEAAFAGLDWKAFERDWWKHVKGL
jgi:tetratricopeptide (TPR) repeat protein